MKNWLMLLAILATSHVIAQNDPEFPKGAVVYLSVQQGKSTSFDLSPDLWVGGIGVSPQFTVIPQHLRIGVSAEYSYTDKHSSGLFGPRVVLKIKTIKSEPFGSIANIQLQADHLWGTRDQRLVGGGLTVEGFQLFIISFTAHRDYAVAQWWFRGGIGVNLLQKKVSGSTNPLKPGK